MTAYEPCSLCGGHGTRTSASGDIADCYECDGSGHVRARDSKGRFVRLEEEPQGPDMSDTIERWLVAADVYPIPPDDGPEFDAWCEANDCRPLAGRRRAWSHPCQSYIRDAYGIAYAEGEGPFLVYRDDLVEPSRLMTAEAKAVIDAAIVARFEHYDLGALRRLGTAVDTYIAARSDQ